MRSFPEITFRLRQELANLWLFSVPPTWNQSPAGPLPGLPDPEAAALEARGNAGYCVQIETLAEELLAHRFRLLGLAPVDLGKQIRWRHDFLHGQETGLEYFRRIPYLDFSRAGDHKVIWELNRHQHLVLLAQAALLTTRPEFRQAIIEEIQLQLASWMETNPFQRGINWASALEVAFRTLSWLWVLHLVGRHFEEPFRRRWVSALYQHGLHLEYNLSFYFSPNTHLLGEAVALNALGHLLPDMPRSKRWRALGGKTVCTEMRKQVRDDGGHFEQSSYYHLYAVDFFLLHSILNPEVRGWYREKLRRMVELLHSLVSTNGWLPLIGDEDGGRLFHPYGDRRQFAEATLVSCASWFQQPEWAAGVVSPTAAAEQKVWWLGRTAHLPDVSVQPPSSQLFADTGLAVLRTGRAHVIFDMGKFGSGSAGHSHADTLSITAFLDGEELLIDPGTFTYISDPEARQRFRGTSAHNTVYVHSLEQAEPQGPFRWGHPPEVKLLHWSTDDNADIVDAQCGYHNILHRRSLLFHKPDLLIVLDRVTGPEGPHPVEQRWLIPEGIAGTFISSDPVAVAEAAERSKALGSREAAMRLVAQHTGELPAHMAAVIRFDGYQATQPTRRERTADGEILVTFDGGSVCFPDQGPPRWVGVPKQIGR